MPRALGGLKALVSDPVDLESAWNLQYETLARKFDRMLPRKGGVLVEVGCGEGQLTIPLARKVPRYKIIALDNFKGPYAGNQARLSSSVASSRLKSRIKVVVSDYHTWLANQPVSKYDGIISSEFLPEIEVKGMRSFFAQCHRITRLGGFIVHTFLSPQPPNARQRRLIEADSDPRWTKTPPLEWFSPPTQMVVENLRGAGFTSPSLLHVKSGLIVKSDAAKAMLKEWDVKEAFWRVHKRTLIRDGLEIPDWIIVKGIKGHEPSLAR